MEELHNLCGGLISETAMQREIITFVFRGETIHLFLGTLIAEVYPCCLFSNLKLLVGEFYVYICSYFSYFVAPLLVEVIE